MGFNWKWNPTGIVELLNLAHFLWCYLPTCCSHFMEEAPVPAGTPWMFLAIPKTAFQRWKTSAPNIFTPDALLNIYFCMKHNDKILPFLEFKIRFLASFLPVTRGVLNILKMHEKQEQIHVCTQMNRHTHLQSISSAALGYQSIE